LNVRFHTLTLGASFALATACIPSLKSAFIDASYPEAIEPLPARDPVLGVDAAVVPSLVVAFDRPREVAACMARVAGDAAAIDAMWAYGACLAEGSPVTTCAPLLPWIHAAGPSSDFGTVPGDTGPEPSPEAPPAIGAPFKLEHRCGVALSTERDTLRLGLALADASEILYGHHLSTAGQAAAGQPLPEALRGAFGISIDHAARLLAASPFERSDPTLPSMALSGGAANGAFISGYVYGLLWLRERAQLYATVSQRQALDTYRFGSVFSSSVGSLVALPVDLYFSRGVPNARQDAALGACIAAGGGPVTALPHRKVQDCALAKLQSDFVKNEWDLLCAQKGSVLEVTEPDFEGMLRFDPLEHRILTPFFESFESLLLGNTLVRTPMAIDLLQHVLVGLDERACRMKGMPTRACLVEGIMGSIVEPIFVPPRARVFSGLAGPPGEAGHWLDGSLRSLNPSHRAAAYTLGKLLVVNTTRVGGVPLNPPKGVVPLVLETTNELGAGQRAWELGYAALYQEQRRERACAIGALVENRSMCEEPEAPQPAAELGGSVLTVWVPEAITPKRFVASGYTFDPVVMRGLFLWGKREFFRSRSRVLAHLGWCGLEAMVNPSAPCPVTGHAAALARDLAGHAATVDAELATLAKYDDDKVWKRYTSERRKQVEKRLTVCR
jgi:hypothetical protein